MSAGVETGSGGRGKQSQDFELNIASIIDSLTVLIAFMLVSASFLSIGILDAGVAAAGSVATNAAPPSINVTVELGQDQKITIKTSGKLNESRAIAGASGQYDLGELTARLGSLKSKWTDLTAVTLTSDESIEYKDVVKVMEALRKSVPVVLLGGF